MQLFSIVVGAAIVAHNAIAIHTNQGIDGYRTEDLSWKIEVSPGRFEIFTGTVQEVHAQALKLNPHFKLQESSHDKKASAAVARDGIRDDYKCKVWPKARTNKIREGIEYLRRAGGQLHLGPGPGVCSRVSCSGNSAIWWCSDYGTNYSLNSIADVANSAKRIVDSCDRDNQVSGQKFEDDYWNTVVRYSSCSSYSRVTDVPRSQFILSFLWGVLDAVGIIRR